MPVPRPTAIPASTNSAAASAARRFSSSGPQGYRKRVTWAEWARPGVVEPSIYAADFARLGEQLESLLDAGARVFHFDIGDGHFIGEITIGPVVLRSIAGLVHERDGVLDCHLMVSQPERHFESVRAAGGDSVTFHVEAVDDPGGTAAHARELGLGSASPSTPRRRSSAVAAAKRPVQTWPFA